jgi:hypothetical protein
MKTPYEVTEDLPPKWIYDACVDKFGIDFYKGVIFTVNNKIHIFDKRLLTRDLLAHELTHIEQQKEMGYKKWWEKYLEDTEFRLTQEYLAYQNQYQYCKEFYSRNARRIVLKHIIGSLSGPMYGNLITEEEARNLLTNENNNLHN